MCCGVFIRLPERRLIRVGMGVGVCGVDVGVCGVGLGVGVCGVGLGFSTLINLFSSTIKRFRLRIFFLITFGRVTFRRE